MSMAAAPKEVKLTDEDYNMIASYAIDGFIKDTPRPTRNFICECYIKAAVAYFNTKKYTVQNGRIYKNEDNK